MSAIEKEDTVLLHFKSIRPGGEVFEDSSGREPQKIIIGRGMINPAFETALIGKEEGEVVSVTLPPEKAYGKYNKHLVIPIKRKKLALSQEPVPGALMTITVKGKPVTMIVSEVTPEKIIVDGNHPLAGETITYEITVVKNLGKETPEEKADKE